MDIKINGTSFTDKVNRDSLRIRRYGSHRSDASFIVEFYGAYPEGIRAGMEVSVTDGSEKVWGGIVEKTVCKVIDGDFYSVGVFARGYESLVSRCVATAVSRTFTGAKNAYNYVYLHYLRAEGIKLSTSITDRSSSLAVDIGGAVSLTELLDIIGNYYGYVWWVDETKTFHAAESFPVTDSEYSIDFDNLGVDGLIEASLAESTEEYRNVQYISLNSNTQFAFVENSDAVTEMKNYSGSGEFGKVSRKSRVSDNDYGKGLAEKMLANFDAPPLCIRFTADDADGRLPLFSKIKVNFSALGGTKDFVVTSTDTRYRYGKRFVTATGYAFSGSSYMPIINTMKSITFTV